jgi:hypothetical protein
MLKHKLVDFIIEFMKDVDKDISEMKLFVCYRGGWRFGRGADYPVRSTQELVSLLKLSLLRYVIQHLNLQLTLLTSDIVPINDTTIPCL